MSPQAENPRVTWPGAPGASAALSLSRAFALHGPQLRKPPPGDRAGALFRAWRPNNWRPLPLPCPCPCPSPQRLPCLRLASPAWPRPAAAGARGLRGSPALDSRCTPTPFERAPAERAASLTPALAAACYLIITAPSCHVAPVLPARPRAACPSGRTARPSGSRFSRCVSLPADLPAAHLPAASLGSQRPARKHSHLRWMTSSRRTALRARRDHVPRCPRAPLLRRCAPGLCLSPARGRQLVGPALPFASLSPGLLCLPLSPPCRRGPPLLPRLSGRSRLCCKPASHHPR